MKHIANKEVLPVPKLPVNGKLPAIGVFLIFKWIVFPETPSSLATDVSNGFFRLSRRHFP